MDRRDWPLFHHLRQRLALRVVEFRRSARRFAVDQTGWTFHIKTQNPIADDLKSDVTNPRRIRAPAAIINFRQGKKPTALASILRSLGQPTQTWTLKVVSQSNRCTQGEPPKNRFTGIDSEITDLGNKKRVSINAQWYKILRSYITYYNRHRTHLALAKDTPMPQPANTNTSGRFVAIPEVGGLHHSYKRLAA